MYTSQATDKDKYAEDGDGYPSHDEHDKGEHVGGRVAVGIIIGIRIRIVSGPATKYPDVSSSEPTFVENPAQSRQVSAGLDHLWLKTSEILTTTTIKEARK